MNSSGPVERVVEILVGVGYRRCPIPLLIAAVPFAFAAGLIGPENALDLVVVADALTERERHIQRTLEGVSRALDLAASRRSLTVVIVGPLPSATVMIALSRVCRVLPIGTPVGVKAESMLRDALAVLLPLELPDGCDDIADPMAEVRRNSATSDQSIVDLMIEAAVRGAEGVKEAFRLCIEEPLEAAHEEEPA